MFQIIVNNLCYIYEGPEVRMEREHSFLFISEGRQNSTKSQTLSICRVIFLLSNNHY